MIKIDRIATRIMTVDGLEHGGHVSKFEPYRDEIITLRESGSTLQKIADRIGTRHRSNVLRFLRRKGYS